MKAAVENAGNDYLKKKNLWTQASNEVAAAEKKLATAEATMKTAAASIREAITESMDKQTGTLWLPFNNVVIEVKTGYNGHSGIYMHRLED